MSKCTRQFKEVPKFLDVPVKEENHDKLEKPALSFTMRYSWHKTSIIENSCSGYFMSI